jgi:hypothetical protein
MKTKIVKATFILEMPEDESGKFLLESLEYVLGPGEKILGFHTGHYAMEELDHFKDMLFQDD